MCVFGLFLLLSLLWFSPFPSSFWSRAPRKGMLLLCQVPGTEMFYLNEKKKEGREKKKRKKANFFKAC